jgi:hypothetical protein
MQKRKGPGMMSIFSSDDGHHILWMNFLLLLVLIPTGNNIMTTLIFTFLLLLFLPKNEDSNYLIVQEKKITVLGNTSLGKFSCSYNFSELNDTLFINSNAPDYDLMIPVQNFDCGNFLLTKDFRNTLKVNEFPQIKVKVLNIQSYSNGTMEGALEIILTGKTKEILCLNLERCKEENPETISIDLAINAAEFNLSPPKRLGGLIKVDDLLNVNIMLILKSAG